NYGVYWYDPRIIQQDLLELNAFLYNAMRGNIADAKAQIHTAGFLHGVGHWGLSAYLGFDTYYYVTYCSISPQVKEAYLQIMNATREYYKRRDVQLNLFGLSAFPKDEEEYERLGEELLKLEDQIEKIAVSSKLFYTWQESRWSGVWNDNEKLLNREY